MSRSKELGGRAATNVPASCRRTLHVYRTPQDKNLTLRDDLICIFRLSLALLGAIAFSELTLPRQIQLGSLLLLILLVLWWTRRRLRRYFRAEGGGRDE